MCGKTGIELFAPTIFCSDPRSAKPIAGWILFLISLSAPSLPRFSLPFVIPFRKFCWVKVLPVLKITFPELPLFAAGRNRRKPGSRPRGPRGGPSFNAARENIPRAGAHPKKGTLASARARSGPVFQYSRGPRDPGELIFVAARDFGTCAMADTFEFPRAARAMRRLRLTEDFRF